MKGLLYQLIEGWVVIVADHFSLLLRALLRVRSQVCNHVGVWVWAICKLLLRKERQKKTPLSFFEKTAYLSVISSNSYTKSEEVKRTHNVFQVFDQNSQFAVRVRNVELDLWTSSCKTSGYQNFKFYWHWITPRKKERKLKCHGFWFWELGQICSDNFNFKSDTCGSFFIVLKKVIEKACCY